MAATHQPLICQLTQRRFENPVKSAQCGHVYSDAAIRSLSRGTREVPCPIGGCSRRIVIAQLQPDAEVMRRLERLENRIFSQ